MDALFSDLRHAARRLRQSPGFTLIAVIIIALGIGANTAIFSIVNAVLFRPQPFARADELVNLYVSDRDGRLFATTSYPEFREFRAQTTLFSGAVAFDLSVVNRVTDRGAEVAVAEYVSADYWQVLGLRPSLGRAFLPEDDQPGGAPVAIVDYATWRRTFGGDSSIIGRTLTLGAAPVTIVGVGPRGYHGDLVGITAEYWLPFGSRPVVAPAEADQLDAWGSRSTWVRARLRPGVTVAQAQAGLDVVMGRLAAEHPESNMGRRARAVPSNQVRFHPELDRILQPVAALLMLMVGLVLAVACSNLASLLLARASGREKEIAVRLALGAGRGRLVRLLLTESVALAALGGTVGLLLAYALSHAIAAFRPPLPIPIAFDLRLDARVLGFTAGLSLVTGVLFGLVPAIRASRPDLVGSLKDDTTGRLARRQRFGARSALVVAQVAVSLVLLAGAGLFVRSLFNAEQVDPGFATERIALMTANLQLKSPEQRRVLLGELVARLEARPDVERVALADRVPLGFQVHTTRITVAGYTPPDGRPEVDVDFMTVGPGYFATLDVPLLMGRAFTRQDEDGGRVVIVSEAAALRFWGTRDAVGRQFRLGGPDGRPLEIVGVARDTKVRTLGEAPRPLVYAVLDRAEADLVTVIAGSRGAPGPMVGVMRRELETLDAGVPVFAAGTIAEHLGVSLFLPRMGAALLSLFSVLAMLLAATGLYGVIAFAVSRRTREIGIRMAVGAEAGQVVGMVVREGMALVAIGSLVGLALALVATRPLRGALYGVAPTDPVALGGVVLLLGVVALGASYLPARRAARVQPVEALRQS